MNPASYHAVGNQVRWHVHALADRDCVALLADHEKEAAIAFKAGDMRGFIEITGKAAQLKAAMAAVAPQRWPSTSQEK